MPRTSRPTLLPLALAAATLPACGGGGLGPADTGWRTVPLGAVGGTGVTGTATIVADSGRGTATITVELRGLAPGTGHAGHVHRGSCADPRAIDVPLASITSDPDGRGSAITAGVPSADLDRGYALQYHVTLDPLGAPIACGDLGPSPPAGAPAGPGY